MGRARDRVRMDALISTYKNDSTYDTMTYICLVHNAQLVSGQLAVRVSKLAFLLFELKKSEFFLKIFKFHPITL
jgi:hypothetical protein